MKFPLSLIITSVIIFLTFYVGVYSMVLNTPKPDFCLQNEVSKQCLDYQNAQSPKELTIALKLYATLIITQLLIIGFILYKLNLSIFKSVLIIILSNISIIILLFMAFTAFVMSTDSASGPEDPDFGYASVRGTFYFLFILFLLIPPSVYTFFYKVFKSTSLKNK